MLRPIHSVFPISGTGKQAEATLLNYVDKQTEMQVKTDHDRKISVEFSLKRINVGGVLMYLGTALDINERIELVAIKQKFIEVVSEQIKVPLARAMGFIQTNSSGSTTALLIAPGKGRGEAALSDMQKAILALDAMVEVDKLETGSFDVELEPQQHYGAGEAGCSFDVA
jgi:signal transduction histidine kinase